MSDLALVEHDLFDRELLQACADEIPDPSDTRWRRYSNAQEMKLEGPATMWGPSTVEYFRQLADMADRFGELFDIDGLTLETIGGGYHLIPPGGYLDVHTDFSKSPSTGHYRRLNVLTYLNHGWEDDDGGELEMWDDNGPALIILPEFGTTAAFATSSTSWHGHPTPTLRWRASLAGYFFTADPPPDYVEQSTVFHPNGDRNA
jgi:Rps23 Pro-64 3,4-dihydroxylase Tpa1-like proline 4-hydroxylase